MAFGNFYLNEYSCLRDEDYQLIGIYMREMLSSIHLYIFFLFADAVDAYILVSAGWVIWLCVKLEAGPSRVVCFSS